MLDASTDQRSGRAAMAARCMPERPCTVLRMGQLGYAAAWELQRRLTERLKRQQGPDVLLLMEHLPVITLGRNARSEHLLTSREQLAAEGIDVEESNRGGDVTFHGPGQLVGYPVLDLGRIRKDVLWYVRTLEEAIIRTLAGCGIEAGRKQGMTGVWVEDGKVAAIGVHISRWVTSHGFALNVDPDLSCFRHIVPCGIANYRVSSLREVLGQPVDGAWLEKQLVHHLGDLLGLTMDWAAPGWLEETDLMERSQPCQSQMC